MYILEETSGLTNPLPNIIKNIIIIMSVKSSASNISGTSLSAKMKRLQIEESLLLQSIFKCVSESEKIGSEMIASSYNFSVKIKKSFREIKLIFQDIKTNTSSKELLKSIDIDDVKRNTLDLENSIKTFKSYLQAELAQLKYEEQHNRDLNENPVLINKFKRHPRKQTAKYNEFVPSPVKTIINSPFKCPEVQEFQEFMMHSINRYGGWNEYHHNIFVNQWLKHFEPQIDTSPHGSEYCGENYSVFHLLFNELRPKLQDISEDEIISHIKWYSKYIYLKTRQHTAISKWRSNRTITKSAQVEPNSKKYCILRSRSTGRKSLVDSNYCATVSEELNDTEDVAAKCLYQGKVRCFERECLSAVNGGILHERNIGQHLLNKQSCLGNRNLIHFQKSTKQWANKLNDKKFKVETNLNNLENIKTLGIPIWRAGL